jgi:LysM repeat protein
MDSTQIATPIAMMEDQMSAAVAWDVAPAPVRVPVRPARPQLVSVPTGAAVLEAPTTPLRITRAGRLALTLTVVVAAIALAVALFSGGSASATVIDHATTVAPGQTLSEIATQQLPQLSTAEGVAQLRIANNLTGSDIHAGQTLLIPAVG